MQASVSGIFFGVRDGPAIQLEAVEVAQTSRRPTKPDYSMHAPSCCAGGSSPRMDIQASSTARGRVARKIGRMCLMVPEMTHAQQTTHILADTSMIRGAILAA